MSVYQPSKHWLIALIPLSVAFAALSNNFVLRESKHPADHTLRMENNRGIRVINGSQELKQHDTAEGGTHINFMKTDTVKRCGQTQVSLKTGKEERERLHKN